MATDREQAAQAQAKKPSESPPSITTEEQVAKLKDELKAFGDDQKRIINASRPLKELNPEDLTTEQQAMLGDLAREEAKEASYFQEKLTDLSKLPLQDFADGKLVQDMNEVYQEVQAASTALYQKRVEIAVPAEEDGLEKAAELEQNLERWLPNTPDNTKWSMEEPAQTPADIPMAELPKQLDDLVGDLLKKEQDMNQDKDDVSSSIMDSIDKGAGWGADDGPMSNMSAKGVTGNQLPNNDEIGGRSGEGRNGKSDGQMVGNTAVGKGGNETPTRMTPTPFENGSVNDQSKDTKGGATGGGKLAGSGQDGLRGPMAPQVQQRVKVLAEQQAKLRQQAESLDLQLRKQRRPTGDLESAINAMKELEAAAGTQNGLGVVQGYHQALDSLQAARTVYAGDRLSRVENRFVVAGCAQGRERFPGGRCARRLRRNDRSLLPFPERIDFHSSAVSTCQMRKLPLILIGFAMLAAMTAHGQSVLENGDFEQADPTNPGKPTHWDLPDGLGVQWTDAPAAADGTTHGKAVRMDTSVSEIAMVQSYAKAGLTQWVFPHPQGNAIAETYGLSLYSEAAPLIPGKMYRGYVRLHGGEGHGGKTLVPRVCPDEWGKEARLRRNDRLRRRSDLEAVHRSISSPAARGQRDRV